MIVYRHIRNDKRTPFYIGIGQLEARAYTKKSRNKHWHHIVSKHGFEVQILFDDLTPEQAFEKEKELICLYKRFSDGGILVNSSIGGDAPSLGHKMSEQEKAMRSIRFSGKGNPMYGKKRPLLSEKNRVTKSKKLVATKLSTGEQTEFASQREAERTLGINQSRINKILLNKPAAKSSGGYTFKFYSNGKS